MDLAELDALFEDRANRRWGVFYHCPSDPRIVAPSRPTWRGYQINFAHPNSVRVLIFYLAVLLGPVSLALTFGPIFAALAFSASVAFLVGLSARLSKQHAA